LYHAGGGKVYLAWPKDEKRRKRLLPGADGASVPSRGVFGQHFWLVDAEFYSKIGIFT
jgi:hypothetical protein